MSVYPLRSAASKTRPSLPQLSPIRKAAVGLTAATGLIYTTHGKTAWVVAALAVCFVLMGWLVVVVRSMLRSGLLNTGERSAWRGVFWGMVIMMVAAVPQVHTMAEHYPAAAMAFRNVGNLVAFALIMRMPFKLPMAPRQGGQRLRLLLDGAALFIGLMAMLWYLAIGALVTSGVLSTSAAGMYLGLIGTMAVFVVALLLLVMSSRSAESRYVMVPFAAGNGIMLGMLIYATTSPAVQAGTAPGWVTIAVWWSLLLFVQSALRQRERLAVRAGAQVAERAEGAYPALSLVPYAIALAVFGLLLVAGLRDVSGPARGLIVGAVVVAGTTLARQFVLLRDNDLLRARLQAQASLDGLTGLRNRWSWETEALRELERADRYDRPVSLLLLDLDHFKQINDTQGHAAGDEVLRAVGECLRTQLRESDLPARIGGDEFVVLLPDTDGAEAERVAEKLRHRLTRTVVHSGNVALTVGASIGAVERRPGTSLADLSAEADQRMYDAKRSRGAARETAAVAGRVAG